MNIKDLVGKTISHASRRKSSHYEDSGFLDLMFTDGTACTVHGTYGGYSSDAYDEYVELIELVKYGYDHEARDY